MGSLKHAGNSFLKAGGGILLALLLAVMVLPLGGIKASAAANSLEIEKTVDNATPEPGETFTYTIQVRCSEDDCLDTQITDNFPAGLAGFEVQGFNLSPSASSIPRTVTWTPGGGATPPSVMTASTSLTIDLQQVTNDPVGVGIKAGSSFTIQLSLKVPDDYPPSASGPIVNTASVSASNADTKVDDATITVDAKVKMGVDVTKTWTPATQNHFPGTASTIGLGVKNTSNVDVDTLTIQEPATAPDGAATLNASNPFTITDFTGFGTTTVPLGCTSVQVDAYVFNGTTWNWVSGANMPTPVALALPSGVTNADVGGVRIRCTGNMSPSDQITTQLGLAQRANHRNDGSDLSTDEHQVVNQASGAATKAGEDPATDQASATYRMKPVIPTVETNKNIDTDRITAGQSAGATLTATNGDTPITSMTIADLNFFNDEITFGGFTQPPGWPAGATSAQITYHLLGGGTESSSFSTGSTPADPSAKITGFEITWTGTAIQPNETGTVKFTIDTSEDTTGGAKELEVTNTVDSEVVAANGKSDQATDSDDLRIIDPTFETSLTKSILPNFPVAPGDSVISALKSQTIAQGDGVKVKDIVIEDSWGGGDSEFWDAFDLRAVAPTQVPAGATLTVAVKDSSGVWHNLPVFGPNVAASTYSLDPAALATALSALGLTPQSVEGIRFSFHKGDGFATDTTLTPNISFTARSTTRLDGDPVTPAPETPVEYPNTATVDADGITDGGKALHDDDSDSATGTIETDPSGGSGGSGGIDIKKAWVEDTVDAQSSQLAHTQLGWKANEGFSPIRITDPANVAVPVNQTVFDAFNLLAVDEIDDSDTPFSDGWFLKYDTITEVELYYSGAWHTITPPGGSWMTAARGFKGYVLTGSEQAGTTGVRVTYEETAADTAARTAAQQPGAAFDPYAPEPGTGVGSGGILRMIDLTWQIRTKTRSSGDFVTGGDTYNTSSEGVAENTAHMSATRLSDATVATDSDDDTILILDQDPATEVAKSVTPAGPLFTPMVGTPAASYPTATWTIVGKNASTAHASYVRIADPATCTDINLLPCITPGTPADATADPFDTSGNYLTNPTVANPFERFNATSITISASIPAEVDLDATTVWLLHYSAGTYTTTSHSATAVNAMNAAALADVVGINVTFQGTDPADTGGTISQDNDLKIVVASILRPTLRSSGANQVLTAGNTVDVTNRAFSQSYDPVISPGTTTGDLDDVKIVLTGGVVNVNPTKTVSPTLINEPAKDTPVTVTLGADQGTSPRSTLSPAQVIIEDQADSPDFWNTFEFTGLGAVVKPAGADLVQVDVYDGTQWVLGTPAATAALPSGVSNADVQGIRFTFSKTGGGLFSSTVPAPNWSTTAKFTVKLRDTYRDSGDPVTFDHVVANTQTSQTKRPDGNDSLAKDKAAQVTLSEGTHELAVNKLTNEGSRLASVGDMVPFDLTFKNVGTGYLTVSELSDVLPDELVYTGTPAPQYTAQVGGLLSDAVTVTTSPDGKTLTFNWPAGGQTMNPGEIFKIRVYLELQPGLGTGETATNTMTVQTEETLTACRNTQTGGSTTGAWAADHTTCGTSDYVGTVAGPNLYTVKGVRTSRAGAFNPDDESLACIPNLTATGGDYYRAPCAGNSEVGGVDDWVLHNVNAGTTNVAEMTIFDQMPVAGDSLLVSGNSRGSKYRPQMVDGSLVVSAPAGTTQTIEVTTSSGVCVNTWSTLTTSTVCEQNGEVWTPVSPSTDWANVSGIRIHLNFSTTANGSLRPGEFVDVNFSTENVLKSTADPSGASKTVPAMDQIAWNQYGVKYRDTGATSYRKLAPSVVGTHVRFGAIEINKLITGPAAGYAPDAYQAGVACSVDGTELDMGSNAVVELNSANSYQVIIDGIPVSSAGTNCVVTEMGAIGAFGETTRTGTPDSVVIDVLSPMSGIDAVDDDQVATITNDFQFTGLSVTKRIDTEAIDTNFGPFEFSMTCTAFSGQAVEFDDDGTTTMHFSLMKDESWVAPANRIPVGATCTVTEDDNSDANDVVITGDNVVDDGNGKATVKPGVDSAQVEFTNAYDSGTFRLVKKTTGPGAAAYGAGPFTFAVTCNYGGQTVFTGAVQLRADESRTFGPYPTSTSCSAMETVTGGANSSTLEPDGGVVTIAESGATPEIKATNVFGLTSLDVVKKRVGHTKGGASNGPFTVALNCTWFKDGQRVPFTTPGGAERVLSKSNGYQASYTDLPSSALCDLEETKKGGAKKTQIALSVNGVTSTTKGTKATVDLSSTTGAGQAVATITNTFKQGAVSPASAKNRGPGGRVPGALPNTGSNLSAELFGVALGLLLAGGLLVRFRRQ